MQIHYRWAQGREIKISPRLGRPVRAFVYLKAFVPTVLFFHLVHHSCWLCSETKTWKRPESQSPGNFTVVLPTFYSYELFIAYLLLSYPSLSSSLLRLTFHHTCSSQFVLSKDGLYHCEISSRP